MSAPMIQAMARTMAPLALAKLAEYAERPGGLDELAKSAADVVLDDYVTAREDQERLAQLVVLLGQELARRLYAGAGTPA